ncbi:MAG: phosphoenolpyruvate carboxylase [Rhodospirillales bacterium]|nr:phosphoenolpyruvate carboxylase [Rhodospirillales bacterium]
MIQRAPLTHPSRKKTNPEDILETFRTRLNTRTEPKSCTFFLPPPLDLALEIDSALRSGTLSLETLQSCIDHLTRAGLRSRARRLCASIGPIDPDRNESTLRAQIHALARPPDANAPIPFSDFKAAVERIHYGFVFTAHPTFSMTPQQNRALAGYAYALSVEKSVEKSARTLWKTLETPFTPPDLASETDQSLEAIDNLRTALFRMRRITLDVAAQIYPHDWTRLRPALCSVATWVGFDLDGRSDIVWTGILARRLELQIRHIEDLIQRIEAIPSTGRNLSAAKTLLKDAHMQARALYDLFSTYDPAHDPDHAALQKASRAMISNADRRMIRPDRVVTHLESALAAEKNNAQRKHIIGILSSLRTEGSAHAQVHFRVNAVQIHNAIRKLVDLTTHPSDPRFRQTYMERILRLLKTVKPCAIHFGNILEEQASARRLFMIVQQIVKHIDAHTPIRFLIAETESALTVLGALYLARRFGVEDHIDICPLFETEQALEEGSRIIETLLENPEFRDYVQSRGRLCIQTGYSDAGRYIGQVPACGSIERLKERIVRRLGEMGLPGVDLLFFDTHGESVGRGGHPDGFTARMDYIAPPALRRLAAEYRVRMVQESSYQGGDGYIPFLHPDMALASMTRVMTRWIAPHDPVHPDPYYDERDAITEFLTMVKQFQAALIDDPDYGALLSVFGPALMRPAGSRATKRQYEGPRSQTRLWEARAFRAIPHNAILAQMGVLVNAACGLGTAISEDPALFRRMRRNSDRFQSLAAIPLRGRILSDPGILQAYILTLDPGLWLARQSESACADIGLADRNAAVAAHLEAHSPFVGLHRIFRIIQADFNALAPALNQARPNNEEIEAQDKETQSNLMIFHAIRIALIQRIFAMAMDIPDYSRMHDIPREDLIQHVFRLDIPMVMRELDEIFPLQPRKEVRADYGEPSEWSGEGKESYALEHARTFQPIARMYEMILDTSAGIIQTIGFVG